MRQFQRVVPSHERHHMPRWLKRRVLAEMYRDVGTLYTHDYEALESANIRELAEEMGIPMGYGRVVKLPAQLHGYEGPRAVARETPPHGYSSFAQFEHVQSYL